MAEDTVPAAPVEPEVPAKPVEPAEGGAVKPEEAAPPPEPAKAKDWRDQRIGQLTAQKHDLGARLAEAERKIAEMAAGQKGVLDESEVERRALGKAQQMVAQTLFNEQCNKIAAEGEAMAPDFMQSMAMLNQLAGGFPINLIEAAMESGKAAEVLYDLGKNPDKAMEVMSLPPIKMAARVATIAGELKRSPRRKVSEVPEPITPKIGARTGSDGNSIDEPGISMEEFVRRRNKQIADRKAH